MIKVSKEGLKVLKKVSFNCLSDTWRTKAPEKTAIISKESWPSFRPIGHIARWEDRGFNVRKKS